MFHAVELIRKMFIYNYELWVGNKLEWTRRGLLKFLVNEHVPSWHARSQVMKFPVIYGTRRFSRAHHCILFQAYWIQCTLHPMSLTSILILSQPLSLFPNSLFTTDLPTKILHSLMFRCVLQAHSIFTPDFRMHTHYESPNFVFFTNPSASYFWDLRFSRLWGWQRRCSGSWCRIDP
jgi:hypothetical protein